MKLIMNENGALDHGSESTISGGTFTIISQPSVKVKSEGAGVYRGPLIYSFAGGSADGFDSGSIATLPLVPQAIPPTAIKVKADGQLVIRLGNVGTMAASGTVSGTATAISGPVEVTEAGQSTWRAA